MTEEKTISDTVLRTFYAEVFRNATAVVQAFAGRVELSVVENIRTRNATVTAEFPTLPAAWCRLLADNVAHAARFDPYRLPQQGDTSDGGAVLPVPGADFATRQVKGMPGFSRLCAVSSCVGDKPGEIFVIACMRTRGAIELARVLRLAADVADGIALYKSPDEARKRGDE